MSASATVRHSPERLVVAATMGPTAHDVHAWRLKVLPDLIEVRADPARFRPAHDPRGRDVHRSCGAVLINLRLAAAQLGCAAVVRLLPDPERPTLLATVRLAGRHRVTRSERLLYAATLSPSRMRDRTHGAPVPLPVLNELAGAARLEGATLHRLPGEGATKAVLTVRGDSPADWLRAGQALQRVLLSAAVRSVGVSAATPDGTLGIETLVQPGDVPQVTLDLTRRPPTNTSCPTPPAQSTDHRQRQPQRLV
ncbi:hypothetical protein [Spirillospora sp. CA-294931]|uniref:hypothetical protein n=1 Tax=Spirillospora sp. CA-294931 TaxID=3240042 RepID=UPI003D903C12